MKSKIIGLVTAVIVLGVVFIGLKTTVFSDAKEASVGGDDAATKADQGMMPIMPTTAPAVNAKLPRPIAKNAPEVQAKIDRLKNLQAEDDAASLAEILAELRNPNPVIRHEAIEATCQFQSRSAIPVLEALAAETLDPAEKKELLAAAEFLKLPTYTEYLAAKKKAKESSVPAAQ